MINTRLHNGVDEYAEGDGSCCHADNRRHMVDTEAVARDLTDIDDVVRLDVVILGVDDIFRTGIKGFDGRYAIDLSYQFDLLTAVELA